VKDNVVSFKMGSTSRQDIVSKDQKEKPGPGNYSSPEKIGGPSFTIGGKGEYKNRNDSPGPGSY